MNMLLRLYHSVRLNLGIKRTVSQSVFIPVKKLFSGVYTAALLSLDTSLLYPISRWLEQYFYRRVVYHYGGDYRWNDQRSQNLDKPTHSLGYGLIHYSIIRNQKPNRVLCVGSMYGFIPYMMAKACKENEIGFVDFVDACYDMKKGSKNHYYGQGFWKSVKPTDHFHYLGVDNYIATHVMTSAEFAKKENWNYDYIYFDGDHSYKGALSNIKLFWPRLNPEGFMCFHDIDFDRLAEGMRFEHGKFWNDLSFLPYKFKLTNHYSGLGFIQKIGNKTITDILSGLKKNKEIKS